MQGWWYWWIARANCRPAIWVGEPKFGSLAGSLAAGYLNVQMLRYWPSDCQLGEYRDEGVEEWVVSLSIEFFFSFRLSECDFLDVFCDTGWYLSTYSMFDDLRYLKTSLHKSTQELNYDEMEEEHQDFPKSPKSNWRSTSCHPKGTKWRNDRICSSQSGSRVRSCCGWSGRHMVMELQNLKKALPLKHRCHRMIATSWPHVMSVGHMILVY